MAHMKLNRIETVGSVDLVGLSKYDLEILLESLHSLNIETTIGSHRKSALILRKLVGESLRHMGKPEEKEPPRKATSEDTQLDILTLQVHDTFIPPHARDPRGMPTIQVHNTPMIEDPALKRKRKEDTDK